MGRARFPLGLAAQLLALPPGLRGQTIAIIVLGHVNGLDVQRLIESASELRRLGVLLNQSVRISGGSSVDAVAMQLTVKQINQLFPCLSK